MDADEWGDLKRQFDLSLGGRLDTDTILEILEETERRGMSIPLRQIVERFGEKRVWGEFVPPRAIVDFAVAYFADRSASSIVDPWAASGALLNEFVVRHPVDRALGIVATTNEMRLAKATEVSPSIKWRAGMPLDLLANVEEQFDAVVSSPPLRRRRTRKAISANGRGLELYDDEARLGLLAALNRLAMDGQGAFTASDDFFFQEGRTVWKRMHELDLYPNAVIGLPERSLAPWRMLSLSIVVVGRRPHDGLFIARLDPQGSIEPLIDNLRERREGALPDLGRLVELETFRGVGPEFEAERVISWGKREELEEVVLDDITERISFFDRQLPGFEEAPNSVYVSTLGIPRVGASTSLAGLKTSPENCFQLVMKPDRALAEYVAAFFNSERGRSLRAAWSVGATMQRIQRRGLGHRKIYLPPLEDQVSILRVDDITRNHRSRLGELQASLWESPRRLAQLERELNTFLVDEGAWIEELPFPIASVLWRYAGDVDPRSKVGHLLHFFEALALFNSSLFLSGFQSDEELFETHRTEWFGNIRPLERPTFGTWTTISSRLGATIRRMLASKAERSLCLDLFRTTKADLIETLASEDVQVLLGAAKDHRNDWSGHGGIANDREYMRRLEILESVLSRFREAAGGAFRGYVILRPRESRYHAGVHHYRAQSLMGSRRDFRTIVVETTAPMDVDRLYLLDVDTPTPLELAPLFRIKTEPVSQEDACYFYNRLEEERHVRLVSYHFEGVPETHDPDDLIVDLIARLRRPPA